jgi:hypothetical protein
MRVVRQKATLMQDNGGDTDGGQMISGLMRLLPYKKGNKEKRSYE